MKFRCWRLAKRRGVKRLGLITLIQLYFDESVLGLVNVLTGMLLFYYSTSLGTADSIK